MTYASAVSSFRTRSSLFILGKLGTLTCLSHKPALARTLLLKKAKKTTTKTTGCRIKLFFFFLPSLNGRKQIIYNMHELGATQMNNVSLTCLHNSVI